MYYVYLLRCRDHSLYCGITINLKQREQQHNVGRGSRYVRSRGGGTIIYSEKYSTLSAALQREAAIKKLTKAQKETLINAVRSRPDRTKRPKRSAATRSR